MDSMDFLDNIRKEQQSNTNIPSSGLPGLKREQDSIDDFEHLESELGISHKKSEDSANLLENLRKKDVQNLMDNNMDLDFHGLSENTDNKPVSSNINPHEFDLFSTAESLQSKFDDSIPTLDDSFKQSYDINVDKKSFTDSDDLDLFMKSSSGFEPSPALQNEKSKPSDVDFLKFETNIPSSEQDTYVTDEIKIFPNENPDVDLKFATGDFEENKTPSVKEPPKIEKLPEPTQIEDFRIGKPDEQESKESNIPTPELEQQHPEKMASTVEFISSWFNPENLHPKVVELVYWRDPKKSGIVFGGVLGILLSLTYFSLISVVAYLSLLVLLGTISFRIYKSILQAVQKTSDGHPFKDILELDLTLPQDKVREVTDTSVAHLNAAAAELRRLFLVEDLVDSLKFGVMLWCLTYVGSWFNGMTLLIIAYVALFTLPKVYETNKAQIDQYLDLVKGKVGEITSKVKDVIPIGKKAPAEEEKKDQ